MARNRLNESFDRSDVFIGSFGEAMGSANADIVMEEILENINTTPIGQVLKKIASLPELRRDKVLNVRQQLNDGQYELSGRLDQVVDRGLEDLTA